MNAIRLFPLALTISFGFLTPLAINAQDQDQNQKATTETKGSSKESKQAPEATKSSKKPEATIKSGKKPSANSPKDAEARVANQSVQHANRDKSQGGASGSISVKGTRSNNYNGQWVAASSHSDWDRSSVHTWNNHRYRWYDGGWIIIDTSTDDSGVTDSVVIAVKQHLAQQGYYNGHFTATVGPRTHAAISHYQADKGLPVSGEIDDPLLQSLQLQ